FATATMKLDQHSIELQLYDNLTRRRAADIKLADDQDQLAAATRTVKSLDAKTAALQAALAPASAGLSSAGQADDAAADDRTALTTLVADAVRQAGGDDVKAQVAAAGQALATLIGGADMLAVLRSRHDHAKAIIGDKQSATARARQAALAVTQLTSA